MIEDLVQTIIEDLKQLLHIALFISICYLLIKAFAIWSNRKSAAQEKQHQLEWDDWLKHEEPRYRNTDDYPPDWELRRKYISLRQRGFCKYCNFRGHHLHHLVPISKGGSHSLSNLVLLCEECHAKEHPDNYQLNAPVRARRAYRTEFSEQAKRKRARKQWHCTICNGVIHKRDEYYGDTWNRVCMKCMRKYFAERSTAFTS